MVSLHCMIPKSWMRLKARLNSAVHPQQPLEIEIFSPLLLSTRYHLPWCWTWVIPLAHFLLASYLRPCKWSYLISQIIRAHAIKRLFGVTILQSFWYFQNYPSDRIIIRSLASFYRMGIRYRISLCAKQVFILLLGRSSLHFSNVLSHRSPKHSGGTALGR